MENWNSSLGIEREIVEDLEIEIKALDGTS